MFVQRTMVRRPECLYRLPVTRTGLVCDCESGVLVCVRLQVYTFIGNVVAVRHRSFDAIIESPMALRWGTTGKARHGNTRDKEGQKWKHTSGNLPDAPF